MIQGIRLLLLAATVALVVSVAPSAASAVPPDGEQTTTRSTVTHPYCVRVAGAPRVERAAFAAQAQQILAERRGWSLGGTVRFVEQASCDDAAFTLWLASPRRLPSFGSICSHDYSCRVDDDVVINRARWHRGTPAWRRAGASLADYRRMVVNHEVGHWLDFRHADCPGRGEPAPLMQQQSIDLQGCRPNPYPTDRERARLADRLGVEVLDGFRDGEVVRVAGRPGAVLVEDGRLRALLDDEALEERRAAAGRVRVVAQSDLDGLRTGPPVGSGSGRRSAAAHESGAPLCPSRPPAATTPSRRTTDCVTWWQLTTIRR
ncbi:DUF3152 domain-containing protein [Egicoccus sp. AB-alg2]|uniref:DUF3152 domain-containing protein n=1 Tax=Egicoccus sp. AB-alg2 TaxID=3242693 RepID=UPI00359EC877